MVKRIIMMIICVIFFSGCHREGTKIEIPKDIKITKLSEILKSPIDYHQKKVLLEGNVAFVTHCHLVYQEGRDSIEIHFDGFKCPHLKKGQRIRVYAEITAGKERVIVLPLKIEEVR